MNRKIISVVGDGEPTLTKPVPNYDIKCCVCEQVPTVDVPDGTNVIHTELCGVCCFGEADCLDVEKW